MGVANGKRETPLPSTQQFLVIVLPIETRQEQPFGCGVEFRAGRTASEQTKASENENDARAEYQDATQQKQSSNL